MSKSVCSDISRHTVNTENSTVRMIPRIITTRSDASPVWYSFSKCPFPFRNG